MKGFFSFFAILSIVLIALYLAVVAEKNQETHAESESALLLADSIHYEKQNVKALFWNSLRGGEPDLKAMRDGLRAKGIRTSFGEPGLESDPEEYIVEKCPFLTDRKCVLITNCKENECSPGQIGFRATIEKPLAKTEFTASAGEYIILD